MTVVSIIIPVYNSKEYLSDAIESVLNQTFLDFELLLVDDGSTDGSESICDQYAKKDNRVKVIHIPNQGVSTARNIGIQQAQGEYIAFSDADDIVSPYFLEEAYSIAVTEKSDFVIGGSFFSNDRSFPFSQAKTVSIQIYEGLQIRSLYANFISDLIYLSPKGSIGRGPISRIIRSDIAKKILFDPTLEMGEDMIWNLALLKNCAKISIVHKVWYLYFHNPASACNRYDNKIIDKTEQALKSLAQYVDFNDDCQCHAYGIRIFEFLKASFRQYINHEKNPMSFKQKFFLFKQLCNRCPWSFLKSKQFYHTASIKEKIKIILFRTYLLYFCYMIKK